jgi:hypothetical protein
LRYRPGIEKDFVDRWLQITTDSFRYFENNIRALKFEQGEQVLRNTLEKRSFVQRSKSSNSKGAFGLNGPLISVPLEFISGANKLNPKHF